ncbi:hypothetical protein TTHERM_000191799 (macronuclear) [Tetrahymena thermophila SB210]|uniref:Uncharacterized protein n=1 Tax=Tetrahymena thermophila (strain SB210) TaxID=312017 RepID=W7X4J6_TETTS|nr:hypothetical protein TTHERM_000191799 [Tetrahymena thermophila SB210]EWS74260.1 hypothetical protein TTHERM_000191799 [Tetrahymena thermophila SB210]|eukprot:XP_012653233.1 hypothetical protein TTHERM_000191799 [Tetrahymena thermophila SB210]
MNMQKLLAQINRQIDSQQVNIINKNDKEIYSFCQKSYKNQQMNTNETMNKTFYKYIYIYSIKNLFDRLKEYSKQINKKTSKQKSLCKKERVKTKFYEQIEKF